MKLAFDLTKAIITTKPSAVFEWTQINDSSVEQHLSIKEEKSITKENTYEFHWNQGARVSGESPQKKKNTSYLCLFILFLRINLNVCSIYILIDVILS